MGQRLPHLVRAAGRALPWLLAAALLAPAGAAEPPLKSFRLRDGSQISGRLLSLEGGHFLIESQSLGRIRVPENNVLSMTAAESPPPAVTSPPSIASPPKPGGEYAQQIEATQMQILASPELLADVQALAQDPQVLALTRDPAFLNAVLSGNVQALQNNPRIAALLNNPKVQQLIGKILAARRP